MGKSKKDEKLTELGYSIEALEDEIEHLHEVISSKHTRVVELIGENDRLTMTYEPYRPPGDEDENISYYDLKEENEHLRSKAWEYKLEVYHYQQELAHQQEVTQAVKTPRRKHAGCLTFDFWPLSDWFRLNLCRWNPGKAFQLCIGPIRLDFFEA